MIAFILAALLTVSDPVFIRYEDAIESCEKTGKPVVIVVGATWCAPCQESKKIVGKLDRSKYILCYVDYDDRPELCKDLMEGTTVPQVIVFSKPKAGPWSRVRYVGAVTREKIAEILSKVRPR